MKEASLNFLKSLINISSPSGFEEPASNLWREYLRPHVKSITGDVYGNSIVNLAPSQELLCSNMSVMLCSHIDEVGFMITYINDEGFIYIAEIGGVDPAVAVGREVVIHNSNGPVIGVTGSVATHLQDEEIEEKIRLHQIYIDIGANSKEDALSMVDIGDPVTLSANFNFLANNKISGKALDDKIGAWCVAETIIELSQYKNLAHSIYGVATVQEEIGPFGASMVAYSIKPTVAIAVDLAHATDIPTISKEKNGDIKLGAGPVISIGYVANKKVTELFKSVAKNNDIPLQIAATPAWSGTDADAIFKTKGGIATGLILIPSRYMHTPVEIVHLDDMRNAVKLLVAFCKELGEFTNFKI